MLQRVDVGELTAIFVGGCLGALVRVALNLDLPHAPGGWPWSTFVANLSGTFILGYLSFRWADEVGHRRYSLPFVGNGFCGALTTFSTLQLELVTLIAERHYDLALAYGTLSVLGGLSMLYLARLLYQATLTWA